MPLFKCSIAAVLAFLLAAAPGVPSAAGTYGALYLCTLPSGVNVWIDGTYVGHTPVLVDPLARGHHAVTLTKTGWSIQEVDVDVPAGTTAMAAFRLHPDVHAGSARPRGSVSFRGLAEGARVAIDGDALGHDPRSAVPLPAGTHVAVITTPAGKISRTFTIYPEITTQVLLSDLLADERPSAIVAPAEEFLPDDSYKVDGNKVVVRYGGHEVIARLGEFSMRVDGTTASYDAAPSRINGRLYLPLALLTRLTETK
jgi:hypothetical protein